MLEGRHKMSAGPKVFGIDTPDRKIIQLGVLLFLIGLLTGFAIPAFTVPRLGLSSHLEGVLNGLFLIALGLIWPRLSLSRPLATLTFVAAIFGTFANWLATLLAGLWGAGKMMPIAGGGQVAEPLAEAIVGALLISLSGAMVFVCLAVLWGLRTAPR
jgi:(hydroxyamino)benzene mutase